MTAVEPVVAGILDELVADDPVLATSLGLPDGLDALTSFSPAAVAARVAVARRGIERLAPVAAAACAATATASDAAHIPTPAMQVRLHTLYDLRRVHRLVPGHYPRYAGEALLPVVLRELAPAADRLRGLEGRLRALPGLLEEARGFVVEHGLATLAEGEQLEVMATPRAMRGVLPHAGYDAPGPFAGRQLALCFVTPRPAGLQGPALAAALAAHPFAAMVVTAVHEAYPGRHVQLTRANAAPTLARRLAGAYGGGGALLVEGRASYCEEMMERQGFLAGPEVRVARLGDQVRCACRLVIDVEVATGRMSFAEAVDLLARETHMERVLAEAGVRRSVESPGESLGYLVGKREVVDLARAFASRRTVSLRAFHDALLDWGSVSSRLIAWGLGLAEPPAAVAGAAV